MSSFLGLQSHNATDWEAYTFILAVLETESKIKVPKDVVPGEGPLASSHMVTFSLCLHTKETVSKLSAVSSYGVTDPTMRAQGLVIYLSLKAS